MSNIPASHADYAANTYPPRLQPSLKKRHVDDQITTHNTSNIDGWQTNKYIGGLDVYN